MLQKTYELQRGAKSIFVNLSTTNKQLDLLEISMTYDKIGQNTTVSNSHNSEAAAK